MARGRLVRGVDEVGFIGIRKFIGVTLNYNDRNDGFCRTFFSRNKHNRSRAYKIGKLNRKRLRRESRAMLGSMA